MKPDTSTTRRVFRPLDLVPLAALWLLPLWFYGRLPASVPIHFNGLGQPDSYGEKGTLLLLPLVATVLFAGLAKLPHYPHLLNYPVRITPENAARQYANVVQMMQMLRWVLALVFLGLIWGTLRVALGQAEGLGAWSLPVTLALIFVPVLWFIWRAYRLK